MSLSVKDRIAMFSSGTATPPPQPEVDDTPPAPCPPMCTPAAFPRPSAGVPPPVAPRPAVFPPATSGSAPASRRTTPTPAASPFAAFGTLPGSSNDGGNPWTVLTASPAGTSGAAPPRPPPPRRPGSAGSHAGWHVFTSGDEVPAVPAIPPAVPARPAVFPTPHVAPSTTTAAGKPPVPARPPSRPPSRPLQLSGTAAAAASPGAAAMSAAFAEFASSTTTSPPPTLPRPSVIPASVTAASASPPPLPPRIAGTNGASSTTPAAAHDRIQGRATPPPPPRRSGRPPAVSSSGDVSPPAIAPRPALAAVVNAAVAQHHAGFLGAAGSNGALFTSSVSLNSTRSGPGSQVSQAATIYDQIPPPARARYESLFRSLGAAPEAGGVPAATVVSVWQRSRVPLATLADVWDAVAAGSGGTELALVPFCAGVWLIDQILAGSGGVSVTEVVAGIGSMSLA
ncbi:Increased rDNA silencing protein [Blastocladiella emersonii ATCC 22665]|nr:Increased rDNA silencing protein [Blastocladiella emersonii ATCC 22665]